MQAKQLYFVRLGLDEDAKRTYMTKAYQMKITLEDSELLKGVKLCNKIFQIMVPTIRWDQQKITPPKFIMIKAYQMITLEDSELTKE